MMSWRRWLSMLAVMGALVGLGGPMPTGAQAPPAAAWRFESTTVSGAYRPLVGRFAGDDADDIFWYGRGSAKDSLWIGRRGATKTSSLTRRPMQVNWVYQPIVGDFAGDHHDDIFWYAPGATADTLWISEPSNPGVFRAVPMTVNGTYTPILLTDWDVMPGKDDILWYAPGGAPDSLWHFDDAGTGRVTNRPATINGRYKPIAGDWSGDGYDDVFWYGPGDVQDSRWTMTPQGTWTIRAERVKGSTYEPVRVWGNVADGILWWRDGPGTESFWRGTGDRFQPVSILSFSSSGTGWSVPDVGTAVVTISGEQPLTFYDDGRRAAWYEIAQTNRGLTSQVPVMADLDDNGWLDILWYGRLGVGDQMWWAVPAAARQSTPTSPTPLPAGEHPRGADSLPLGTPIGP